MIEISEGAGVRNVTLSIDYNPELLEITAAAPGANMPAGTVVTLDTAIAGTAVLTFASTVDLPAGANALIDLSASVPTANGAANYLTAQEIDIHSISITDAGAAGVPAIDIDALHVVEYFADVTGNGRLNAADASQGLAVEHRKG